MNEFTKACGGSFAGASSLSEGILRKVVARLSRLALLSGALLVTVATLPTNAQIINGQDSISSNGIDMTTPSLPASSGLIDIPSNIAKGHCVLFVQPNVNSIAFNWVVGNPLRNFRLVAGQ
ncbi:MAG: hypothetical protein VB135_03615 [Burkholderia sp.]